jgi:hypothetical protein
MGIGRDWYDGGGDGDWQDEVTVVDGGDGEVLVACNRPPRVNGATDSLEVRTEVGGGCGERRVALVPKRVRGVHETAFAGFGDLFVEAEDGPLVRDETHDGLCEDAVGCVAADGSQ